MVGSATRSARSLAALAAVWVLLHAVPAEALNIKSYVSSSGVDSNTCADPGFNACATFQGALAKTAPGGEITVANTGNYGSVDIFQSVNITNDGAGEASILVSGGGEGIGVAAGIGDVVSLRGPLLDGQRAGVQGIGIASGSAVHIQNCVIRNIEGSFAQGINAFGGNQLFVSDTIIFNNGSTAGTGGILIRPFGSMNVVLDRVHLENNVVGLRVDGTNSTGDGAHVVMRDSVVSGNAADSILALSAPGKAPAFILVEHTSSVSNGGIGIHADGPRATILLKDDTITRNGAGISATNSGQLISYGNNSNNNNVGPEGTPTGLFSLM